MSSFREAHTYGAGGCFSVIAVLDVMHEPLDMQAYDDEAEKHNDGYDGDQPGLDAELSKTRQFN